MKNIDTNTVMFIIGVLAIVVPPALLIEWLFG